MDNARSLLELGIAAFKAGDVGKARSYFLQTVTLEPDDERAWGWLSNTAQTDSERIRCLREIARINPQNSMAAEQLKELERKAGVPEQQAAASRPMGASVPTALNTTARKRGGVVLAITATGLALILLAAAAWVIVRPGVFTVQPIGAIPKGVTLIYYSRSQTMPFFSSPDGLCLQTQGSVSLLCRMVALSAASELTDRMILRLPYSHWAYLQSTGGLEFDR